MIDYLITGSGRCGTGYAARLLSSAGVTCGHESLFSFDGYDLNRRPGLQADSSWLAAPFLADEALRDVQVVHLVRHPRHVIESLVRMRFFTGEVEAYRPYEDFARRYVPYLNKVSDPVEAAARFVVEWNAMIEANAPGVPRVPRVRVEDCPAALLETLDIDPGARELFDNRSYNTRGDVSQTVKLNLPEALRRRLAQMARAYGYKLDRPPARPMPPRVFWAYLLIPAVYEVGVNAALNVAQYCGHCGYSRIQIPYMRTDRARNVVVSAFLEESRHPDDVLVFLDCDHEHPHDIVERLASHPPEHGVVGALAFRRSAPHDPLFFVIGDDGVLHRPETWVQNGTYRCDVVGSGAIAIRRWVFDRLADAGYDPPWFRYEYPEQFGKDQSEDVYFARLCHAVGIHHYCDTGVEIPHLIHAVADAALWSRNQEVEQ